MAQEIKELILKELETRFRDLPETGCVVVGYQGVKANEVRALRSDLKDMGGEMTVIRNRLFAIAMDRAGVPDLRELLDGPSAVVRAANPVDAAKAAQEMAKACEAIQVRGGYVDGNIIDAAGVLRLSKIPSREVLLSQIVGALVAPIQRLAAGLLSLPRELLSCVEQMREKAAGESAEAAAGPEAAAEPEPEAEAEAPGEE